MKNKGNHILLPSLTGKGLGVGLLLLFLLAACGTQKKAVSTTPSGPIVPAAFTADNYMKTMLANRLSVKNLTAKVKVCVTMGDRSISTNGTLRMRRDDVIQISLVDPLVGIAEVGRMEFTPTNVLIIDRFNKQYIDVPYAEVSFLKRANVDFNTLQSLFWNEVFEPGKSTPSADDFMFTHQQTAILMDYNDRVLNYHFKTTAATAQLYQTAITSPSDKTARFAFDYEAFEDFDRRPFPRSMVMSFQMGSRAASLSFELSNVRSNSDWQAHTPAPSKYKKADAEGIFRSLVK